MSSSSISSQFCSRTHPLEHFLLSFPIELLLSLIKKLELVSPDLSSSWTQYPKKIIVQSLFDYLPKGLSQYQIAELALHHAKYTSKSKQWKSFKLEAKNPINISQPKLLEQSFSKELSKYIPNVLCVRNFDGVLWVRIGVFDTEKEINLIPPPKNNIFVIYSPHTDFILITPMKSSIRGYILQALMNALNLEKLSAWDLSGRNVDSLLQLLLYSNSQGAIKSYEEQKEDKNPLDRRSKKLKIEKHKHSFLDEDVTNRKKLQTEIENIFGNNNSNLPKLEKLEYELQGSLQEQDYIVTDFKINVEFHGKHVLQGMKELMEKGMIVPPIPKYFTQLPNLTKNKFHIQISETKEKQ